MRGRVIGRKLFSAKPGLFFLVALLGLITLQFIYNPQKARADWYGAGNSWGHRKQISIDYTKVTASQTDFPVLISLTSDTDLAADAQNDFDDILFTSSDGTTKLSHEIEQFDESTGKLIVWVKVPNLSSSVNTLLYMYYGNASASNQQDVANVWDSNFKSVLHLSESGTTTVQDSTSNNNDGTKVSSTSPNYTASGKIAGAQTYNGTTDYMTITGGPALSTNGTFGGWFYWDSTDSDVASLIRDNTSAAGVGWLIYGSTGNVNYRVSDTSFASSTTVASTQDKWTYFVVTKSGGNTALYIDGSSVHTGSGAANTASALQWHIMKNGGANNFIKGTSDELRFSDNPRSDTWIQTEYNNQNSPSTFYSLGGEENYNAPPNTPTLSSPADAATIIPLTGSSFQSSSTDSETDTLKYYIKIFNTTSQSGGNCSGSLFEEQDQNVAQGGWSQSAAYASGATATYSNQTTLVRGSSYCWQVSAKDPAGSNTSSAWSTPRTFTVNSVPNAPTLSQPTNGASGQPLLPEFRMVTTDADSDYLKYKIELCLDNTWPCTNGLITIDQTSSQTGWISQNTQSSTAYISGQVAIHRRQTALTASQTYYWKAYARDPAGVDAWSSGSSASSFTTGAENSNTTIQGGVNIRGGTTIR